MSEKIIESESRTYICLPFELIWIICAIRPTLGINSIIHFITNYGIIANSNAILIPKVIVLPVFLK